ncbi:hypothetical protein CP557_10890 [Natrinema ejinorense]|uniref:Uncharacterized protein n=1 Tax=Natrinema ejinorense TaxID=373386 RepID=A0A2A5QVZ6_9EURY|nr:hypothetical protein CP557_10890 [Natrinema ejinorense]
MAAVIPPPETGEMGDFVVFTVGIRIMGVEEFRRGHLYRANRREATAPARGSNAHVSGTTASTSPTVAFVAERDRFAGDGL